MAALYRRCYSTILRCLNETASSITLRPARCLICPEISRAPSVFLLWRSLHYNFRSFLSLNLQKITKGLRIKNPYLLSQSSLPHLKKDRCFSSIHLAKVRIKVETSTQLLTFTQKLRCLPTSRTRIKCCCTKIKRVSQFNLARR